MDRERDQLARLAARVENDPFFVGFALAAYRGLEGLDGSALAAYLGCDEAALVRLALCRLPEGESPMFGREVRQIAEYAGCNPFPLANLLRAVATAERQRAADRGALAAARDRVDEEEEERETPPSAERDPEEGR